MRPLGFLEPIQHEAPQMQAVEYAEFEAAITKWEARMDQDPATRGYRVERSFTGGERVELAPGVWATDYQGKEWKRFAMFLGSREAKEYRQKWGKEMDLVKMYREWDGMRELEMKVDGEDTVEERMDND